MQYRPEKHNVLPDALLQQPEPPTDARSYGDACLSSMVLEPSQLVKVRRGQQSDVALGPYLEKAKSSYSEFILRQMHGLSLFQRHPKTKIY